MTAYIGRFAPSPTGPLHFGSLIAAVASYLEARRHHGTWLVRMEDLDEDREMPGAAADILQTLESCGFEWDRHVMFQSQRKAAYAAALEQLRTHGLAYPCACTRKEIADSGIHGIEGLIYPGTCRHGLAAGKNARAWRIRVPDRDIHFEDDIQGNIHQNLAREIGDFVLKRADGFFAYQLAVCVDDAEQGITHIVRGADLLNSTARQIFLQQALGLLTPRYAHVPVAGNADGEKLSKQTLAKPLDSNSLSAALFEALTFLGQSPPMQMAGASLKELWQWAQLHWSIAHIPKQLLIISQHG